MWLDILKIITSDAMQNPTFREDIYCFKCEKFSFSVILSPVAPTLKCAVFCYMTTTVKITT